MRICLVFRQGIRNGRAIECYPRSAYFALKDKGHEVTCVGEGHKHEALTLVNENSFDLLLEIENGRSSNGELFFHQGRHKWKIPSAVWFIDSHGQPSLHKRLAGDYNHVFFAVWDRRNLFKGHPSSHWCPNATDLTWFDGRNYPLLNPEFKFGFFGSKGGLSRADPLVEVCKKRDWSYDVRQVSKAYNHRWPECAEAMAKCYALFNHGQKHDGPNQRVMESMAMGRPLITDVDNFSGMSRLFKEGKHFIGYEAYTYEHLERQMEWVLNNELESTEIAVRGCEEVRSKHLVTHRMDQILEVVSD